MLPGPRRLLVAGTVAGPGRVAVEGLQIAEAERLERRAAITIMLGRRIVDAEHPSIITRADDHRHRIAVEQQAERSFALLQLGDVDPQADAAAVLGQPLLDQDDAAARKVLFVTPLRME